MILFVAPQSYIGAIKVLQILLLLLTIVLATLPHYHGIMAIVLSALQ